VFFNDHAPKADPHNIAKVARVGSGCFLTLNDVAKLQISFRFELRR